MAAAPLYCVCRQPYDVNRFMIECDICKDWFHGRYEDYKLFNICETFGMFRLPCHGCILWYKSKVSCESAGDARWGDLNMTVRDHVRLAFVLRDIDRFLTVYTWLMCTRNFCDNLPSSVFPSGLNCAVLLLKRAAKSHMAHLYVCFEARHLNRLSALAWHALQDLEYTDFIFSHLIV